jgi:alanine racemase
VLTQPRALIDTSALRRNLARVRELAPDSRVMAVIKANAYGHGLETAAAALAGADGLAVARVEEALALRAAGSRQRILLLEGVSRADQLEIAAREDFDVMVHSHEQLVMLEQRSQETKLRTWIKVDTGMNRLGFRVEEFADALARLVRTSGVAGHPTIATHLASADAVADPKTQQQLDAFEAATAGVPGERSVANSAGILAWPAARRDWVRPGLMLYGASPFPGGTGADIGVGPVMSFQSEVIAVKTVESGETVGYGGAWRATRQTCMAVVAVGYGDGYPRSARAGTPLLIDGQRAPLIGRVSMDMITADVSGLAVVRVGAPVELWGGMLPVEEVAGWADRIPYELTCGVTQRAPRVFR